MPYHLSCDACQFEAVVATLDEVLPGKERHESAMGDDHTVVVEAVEAQPLFRGGVSDGWE